MTSDIIDPNTLFINNGSTTKEQSPYKPRRSLNSLFSLRTSPSIIAEAAQAALNDGEAVSVDPKEIFDEIPSEEYLDEIASEGPLSFILGPSNILLTNIENYLQASGPSYVLQKPPAGQYFFYNNKYYLPSEEQLNFIYTKIVDLDSFKILNHSIHKRPNLFKELKTKILDEKLLSSLKDENRILKVISDEQVIDIFTRLYTIKVTDSFKRNDKESYPTLEDEHDFNNLAHGLGRLLYSHYLQQVFKPESIFAKVLNEKLEAAIEDFENETSISMLFERIFKEYDLSLLGTKQSPYKYASSIKAFFIYTLLDLNLIDLKDPKLLIAVKNLKVEASYEKAVFTTGAIVLDALVNCGILIKGFRIHKLGSKIPTIRLGEEYQSSLISSAAFFKPLLTMKLPQDYSEEFTLKYAKGKTHTVDITLNKQDYRQGHTTHIKPSKELLEIMEEASHTKITLDHNQIDHLFDLMSTSLRIYRRNYPEPSNEDIHLIFKGLYDIDLVPLINASGSVHSENYALLQQLVAFGLSFDDPDNISSIKAIFKSHYSFMRLAFRIYAYKFYFRGLLPELNIYRHFGYFYIPKFIASTGRMFAKTFFLNLQNFKIMKAFMIHYKKPDYEKVDEVTFNLLRDKLLSLTAHIPVLKPINKLNYEDLEVTNRKICEEYLQSMLKKDFNYDDFDLDQYFSTKTILDKFRLLSPIIKKQSNMFHANLLLSALEKNDYSQLIIEKDATSSGIQYVSLLTRNRDLALLCNVQGSQYYDIYNSFAQAYKVENMLITSDVELFISTIYQTSLEDFVNTYNYKNFTEDSTTKSLNRVQKLILTILYTPYDKLKPYIDSFEYLLGIKKSRKVVPKDPLLAGYQLPLTQHEKDTLVNFSNMSFPRSGLFLSTAKLNTHDITKLRHFRRLFRYQQQFSVFPDHILYDRKICKQIVMLVPYGGGKSAMKKSIIDYLNTYIIKGGSCYSRHSLLDAVATKSTDFFLHLISTDLLPCIQFFNDTVQFLSCFMSDIMKDDPTLSKMIPSLEIILKYHGWGYLNLEETISRFRHGVNQFSSISYLNRFNAKYVTTFPSIYVHGIESQVIYTIYSYIRELNLILEAHNCEPIGFFSNHDCYGITGSYAYLLDILVKASLDTIGASNYYDLFAPHTSKYPPVEILNENFIRF